MASPAIPAPESSPTFADLCDKVRQSRIAYRRAIADREAAERRVLELKAAEHAADDNADAARFALDRFIDRETEVDA